MFVLTAIPDRLYMLLPFVLLEVSPFSPMPIDFDVFVFVRVVCFSSESDSLDLFLLLSASLDQPTSSAIKEGDTVLYKPTAEGESEVRAKVIKVHADAGGAHYTILPQGKDAKEKNTTAERISKVCFAAGDARV